VGHENSIDHLRGVYSHLDMVHGVVMGNRSLNVADHDYPTDLFHYCVGLDSALLEGGKRTIEDLPDRIEEHLKRESCCGVKLYPGYNKIWLSDPVYQPVYDLAARYDKPVAVHMGLTRNLPYSGTKGALSSMARAFASELSPCGIRVNAVAPGWIETELVKESLRRVPERREMVMRRSMLGRLGTPEDIGRAVVFLASDAASFITAAELRVDGGISVSL